jgi:hypothetical protein
MLLERERRETERRFAALGVPSTGGRSLVETGIRAILKWLSA